MTYPDLQIFEKKWQTWSELCGFFVYFSRQKPVNQEDLGTNMWAVSNTIVAAAVDTNGILGIKTRKPLKFSSTLSHLDCYKVYIAHKLTYFECLVYIYIYIYIYIYTGVAQKK